MNRLNDETFSGYVKYTMGHHMGVSKNIISLKFNGLSSTESELPQTRRNCHSLFILIQLIRVLFWSLSSLGVQVQVLKKTQGFYIWVCPKTGDIQLWQCWEIIYNPIRPIVQFLLLFGRPTRWHVLKPQSSFGPGYDLNICRESGPWASGGHFRSDIELQISKERLPKEAAFKRNETWNSNDCGVLWYFHGVARFLPKVFDFVVTQKRHGVFEAKQLAQLAVP